MKYFQTILFIVCLSFYHIARAQENPESYNKDSLQKMIKNIMKDIKIPGINKDLKELENIPKSIPFADSNSQAQKIYSELMKQLNDALKIRKEKGDKKGIVESYLSLGDLNIKMNKPSEARQYLQNSIQISKELNDKNSLASAYGNLSFLDDRQGNYKEAYEYYKLYTIYKDSVENIEISKKFLQERLKHEYEIKEANAKAAQAKKDAAAKRTRNIQYMVIVSLGFIVMAAFIIVFIQRKNNKQKQKANLLLQVQKEKVENTLSELKSTQAQLIQSEKMASLGELTAGIAHEIQNPLNFVNNFSEVNKELLLELQHEINNGNVDDAKTIANDVIENEDKINHHGKRADAIVKGMLQHSRSGTGQKELIDINALADEYLRLSYHGLRAQDKSFNAVLETDFDESIGKIKVVPQDMGRVLLNVFNNAFYAVQEKNAPATVGEKPYQPTVSVTTKKIKSAHGRESVELTVKDNGNGIPQKILNKIFQPFFTTKPAGAGTGLGLSISYDIIKAHGGEIKVETHDKEGTKFIIQLPLT
jgi:two-component system, NtrC family, sensor kinase